MTTITPMSKLLALCMLVIFPVLAFFLGTYYERSRGGMDVVQETNIPSSISEDAESVKSMRCGDFPDNAAVPYESKYFAVHGPSWSEDCRNLVWSLWETGEVLPGGLAPDSAAVRMQREGIFVFTEKTGKVSKVYSPKMENEQPNFLGWKDSHVFLFQTSAGIFSYDLRDGELKVNQ